ncbi:N-acetylneuraminate synthase family protein [Termitidicoccus mucosus]|uniref:N-acetylneuraminic acid synthase n=1 Tax=Termitidicoccus mucosus TaxID=1184151 RepID=A0A178IKD7_9BACT|nr:N-acetylneuraminic acid synthase [Opitutaceae bacterium TSB47]
MNRDIFENLFVLEMTNNHQGNLKRALDIVHEHSRVVRFNNVRAAIKLQFRDVDSFVHKGFRDRADIRYIKRVLETKMSKGDYAVLVEAIKKSGCIPMATPFDEKSVDWCVDFNMPIIKIASADSNDWLLLERIAATRKPCIISFGATPLKDMDDVVTFFENRNIPLAINHCVAAYPHENAECELNQIDFFKKRYPGHTIGWSCHEYKDWDTSIKIAYAKGARTFERHIDIDTDGFKVAAYSSLPGQLDIWFKAFHKAVEFCGTTSSERKLPLAKETAYLDTYIRGVYAKHDLKPGQLITEEDIYLAIPLQKGQLSCRELMLGRFGHKITKEVKADAPLVIDDIDTPYSENDQLKQLIYNRGL